MARNSKPPFCRPKSVVCLAGQFTEKRAGIPSNRPLLPCEQPFLRNPSSPYCPLQQRPYGPLLSKLYRGGPKRVTRGSYARPWCFPSQANESNLNLKILGVDDQKEHTLWYEPGSKRRPRGPMIYKLTDISMPHQLKPRIHQSQDSAISRSHKIESCMARLPPLWHRFSPKECHSNNPFGLSIWLPWRKHKACIWCQDFVSQRIALLTRWRLKTTENWEKRFTEGLGADTGVQMFPCLKHTFVGLHVQSQSSGFVKKRIWYEKIVGLQHGATVILHVFF